MGPASSSLTRPGTLVGVACMGQAVSLSCYCPSVTRLCHRVVVLNRDCSPLLSCHQLPWCKIRTSRTHCLSKPNTATLLPPLLQVISKSHHDATFFVALNALAALPHIDAIASKVIAEERSINSTIEDLAESGEWNAMIVISHLAD